MKSKFKQFKEAVNNTPPERLAKVEYQSHFLQMLGVSAACIILIVKGFWYVIFAFIFSLGISYSQGMMAYKKYHAIMNYVEEKKPEDFENDISPSRRRSNIVKYIFGSKAKWISIILSVTFSLLIFVNKFSIPNITILQRILFTLGFLFTLLLTFIFLYLIVFFKLAYPMYKRRVKK